MARPRAARGGPVSVPGRRIAPAGPLIIPSFLEQVDRVGGGRRQPHRIALDRGDEPGGQIMMSGAFAVLGLRAVALGQFDAVAVQMIDGPDMEDRNSVGAGKSVSVRLIVGGR